MSGSGFGSQRRLSGAFVVFRYFIFLGFLSVRTVFASCEAPSKAAESAIVKSVIDGDTIELVSGERIRITGLNAPEKLDAQGQSQPFAEQSHQFLELLIRHSNQQVILEPDVQTQDKHGRTLAHLFAPDGTSITRKLLLAGMAARATVIPNTRHSLCYQHAEDTARQKNLGLWRFPEFWFINHAQQESGSRGFYIIRDEVRTVAESRKSLWINLVHGTALRIARKDLPTFSNQNLQDLQGHTVEARGWVSNHKNRVLLRIRDPINLRLIDP